MKPRTLSVKEITGAAEAASYTLERLLYETRGDVVLGPCKSCGKDVSWLVLPGTGQRIEILGYIKPAKSVELFGELKGWDTAHPVLDVCTTPRKPLLELEHRDDGRLSPDDGSGAD